MRNAIYSYSHETPAASALFGHCAHNGENQNDEAALRVGYGEAELSAKHNEFSHNSAISTYIGHNSAMQDKILIA